MNNFSVIILALFVSLNSFWLLHKVNVFAVKEEVKDEIIKEERVFDESEYEKNKEKNQKNIEVVQAPQVVPFQPIRNEEISDLALPEAHASLILDVDSGTILHYDDGKERRQIASLTKMMTAVLTVETVSNLDEEVVVTEEAVYVEGTRIGCPRSGYCIGERLKVGEKISVRSLLKAMLMNSANDAATALAVHISGSVEEFANLMNQRAREMGLKDSNFCTPSGLEINGKEEQCYSTAYDIARIGAYSLQYDVIWDMMRLPEATIFSADGKYSHDIMNTDQLLGELPNFLGGKTGFTPLAGRSLMVAAHDESSNHRIIAVVLDDPYRWQDAKSMIKWTFQAYTWK